MPSHRFQARDGGRLLADGRTRAFEAVGFNRSRPIRAEIGVGDLANPAFPQPLDAGAVMDARGDLRAELGHDALLDRRLGEHAHFGDVVAQRLLAIDVFALLNGAVGDGEMRMVGHRGVDGVNPVAFLLEQLAPVGVGAGAGHGFGRLVEVVGVHVAQRHDLDLWVLQEVLQVHPAHAADSDAGVVQLAVGGNRFRTGLRAAARNEERRGDAGHGRRAQELAAGPCRRRGAEAIVS